jgi:Putative auto-transporter adhesin, head GIN domain
VTAPSEWPATAIREGAILPSMTPCGRVFSASKKGEPMTTAPTPIPRGHAPHRLYVVLLAALVVLLGTGVVLLGHGSFTTKTPMSVEVTVPTLAAASLSGSGGVAVEGVDAARFTASLSGSGMLTVTGRARRLEGGLAGSGDLRLQGLESRDARATVSGSGRLQVRATRTLHASVPGSGAIFYSGNPERVIKSVTGAGTILGL